MSDETIYRAILITLLVTGMPISIYYRRKAAKSGEKISRRDEGLPILILSRLSGLSILVALLAYLINPQWMKWSALPLPAWLRWLGAGVAVVTIPLVYWAFRSLGKNLTDTVATRKDHTLVTSGPYRWVRHPLHSLVILGWLAMSLVAANWFLGLMIILGFVILLFRTPIEEAKLIDRFGDEYQAYMKRTGRFLPRLFG